MRWYPYEDGNPWQSTAYDENFDFLDYKAQVSAYNALKTTYDGTTKPAYETLRKAYNT